jgi:isopenicillin N synthase-like dioxygenase
MRRFVLHFPLHARSMASKPVIPIIDISPYRRRDPVGTAKVAAQIAEAGEEIGFFSIAGHGVDPTVIDRCWKATADYFDQPADLKCQIKSTKDYPYGYFPMSKESLARGYGKAESLPDLNESFCIGPYNPAAGMPPVQFPSKPAHVQEAWLAYYTSLEVLSLDMLRIFALALKMPENFFDPCVTRHRSALRFLNYPAQDKPPMPGQVRAGAHTDYGSLTILLQDGTGGLQVRQGEKGDWTHAQHVPGTFLINIGDLMQRWTNDKWVSTLHRVVNPIGQEEKTTKRRQSIAFFQNINHDYNVSAIPTCVSATHPRKYSDILAWDHLMAKHTAATS